MSSVSRFWLVAVIGFGCASPPPIGASLPAASAVSSMSFVRVEQTELCPVTGTRVRPLCTPEPIEPAAAVIPKSVVDAATVELTWHCLGDSGVDFVVGATSSLSRQSFRRPPRVVPSADELELYSSTASMRTSFLSIDRPRPVRAGGVVGLLLACEVAQLQCGLESSSSHHELLLFRGPDGWALSDLGTTFGCGSISIDPCS